MPRDPHAHTRRSVVSVRTMRAAPSAVTLPRMLARAVKATVATIIAAAPVRAAMARRSRMCSAAARSRVVITPINQAAVAVSTMVSAEPAIGAATVITAIMPKAMASLQATRMATASTRGMPEQSSAMAGMRDMYTGSAATISPGASAATTAVASARVVMRGVPLTLEIDAGAAGAGEPFFQ